MRVISCHFQGAIGPNRRGTAQSSARSGRFSQRSEYEWVSDVSFALADPVGSLTAVAREWVEGDSVFGGIDDGSEAVEEEQPVGRAEDAFEDRFLDANAERLARGRDSAQASFAFGRRCVHVVTQQVVHAGLTFG
ncbi:MAG: hypothetical protein WAS51_10955 [Ilumatobacteraceae bacterium]